MIVVLLINLIATRCIILIRGICCPVGRYKWHVDELLVIVEKENTNDRSKVNWSA